MLSSFGMRVLRPLRGPVTNCTRGSIVWLPQAPALRTQRHAPVDGGADVADAARAVGVRQVARRLLLAVGAVAERVALHAEGPDVAERPDLRPRPAHARGEPLGLAADVAADAERPHIRRHLAAQHRRPRRVFVEEVGQHVGELPRVVGAAQALVGAAVEARIALGAPEPLDEGLGGQHAAVLVAEGAQVGLAAGAVEVEAGAPVLVDARSGRGRRCGRPTPARRRCCPPCPCRPGCRSRRRR